jgi:hypothetical protein
VLFEERCDVLQCVVVVESKTRQPVNQIPRDLPMPYAIDRVSHVS